MRIPIVGCRVFGTLLLGVVPSLASSQQTDLDVLMAQALEHREVNWAQHYNYFYREREVLSIEGSIDNAPLHGSEREYLWYVRDGYMVRSPVSVDGVAVPEDEREQAELGFIERLRARDSEKEDREVDRRSFFGFDFEAGNYYYAGRQMFEGRELVVVEHFPLDAFGDDDESPKEVVVSGSGDVRIEDSSSPGRPVDRSDAADATERRMNKVMFATMLVDPREKQIVRMTIDNLGFDFLPARWLVQIGTVEATMTMHEPFDGIWLTRDIEAFATVTTAAGDLSVRYSQVFSDYVEIQATSTYSFPEKAKPKKPRRE